MPRTALRSGFQGHDSAGPGMHASTRRFIFVIVLSVAALLAFAGCGLPGHLNLGTPKPTATPSAQQILANAEKAHITDEAFTMTMNGTTNGSAFTATGNGKATTNPQRISLSMSMNVSDTTVAFDEVMDIATKTSYTRITAPSILATNKWVKNSDTTGLLSSSDLQINPQYSKLTNAKLIGTEQINGVTTWHLQATSPASSASSGLSGNLDIYLRQSDYLPVKMTLHATGDTAVDLTIVYTSVNTGITIDLPNV